jgi:tetratricopeptide (TPR) repeat protein
MNGTEIIFKTRLVVNCFFKLFDQKNKFIKTLFIASGLCLLFSDPVLANNMENLYNRANEFYKKEQYDTAIIIYESILKSGFEASSVYYNLGNAYYKKKNIAEAVLNYERAHKLTPNDENINFNLQLTQMMIVDKINTLPEFFLKHWWRSFSEWFSSNDWGTISIVFFVLTLIFAVTYLFTRRLWVKKLSFWLVLALFSISLISFINSYELKKKSISKSSAIVMTPSVTIKSSPDENGTDLFVIHEGLKIWIVDKVENWSKIVIADGNSGWIKNSDIEPI